MKKAVDCTDSELYSGYREIETNLENLGKEFKNTDENAFTEIDGDFYNAKDILNDQIFDCYSAMGSILIEMDRRGIPRPNTFAKIF